MSTPEPESEPAPSRMRTSRWAGFGASLLIGIGWALIVAVAFMRWTVLDPTTYRDALADAEAYDRVYSDVLADPELVEAQEDLLGGLVPAGISATDARVVSVNALRWTLPPSRLQAATELFLDELLAYIRGDRSRLDGSLSATDLVERISDSVVTQVRAYLARARTTVINTRDAYQRAVDDFVTAIRAGTIPASIPLFAPSADAPAGGEDAAGIVLDVIGEHAEPDVVESVEVAVVAGDQRSAIIELAAAAVIDHVANATAEFRADLVDGRSFDVIAELADRADRSQAEIVDDLDGVRRAASWFAWPTALFGAVLIAAVVALVVRRSGWTVAAATWVAGGFVSAAVLFVVGWLLVAAVAEAPLDAATSTDGGAWGLPGGIRRLLADVALEIGGTVRASIVRLTVVSIGIAMSGLAVAALSARLSAPHRVRRGILLLGGAIIGIGAVAAVVDSSAGATRRCNGDAALCDRPYDDVVFAATHNSMSSPGKVEVWPEHDLDVRRQLDSGVRALLIDTHYWPPIGSGDDLADADPTLSSAVRARVFESLGAERTGRPGTFLCHNHCAFGATPIIDALDDIADFLADNPDDVVTLVIQDAVSPADTVAAFTDAGLIDMLYAHERGDDWPTLGQLVDRDARLVVFAEAQGGDPPWYHVAFDHIRETPYFFEDPTRFSCAANRGPADAPLFMMNHWIQRAAPDRADAVVVNQRDVLVERARACAAERGQLPNFLAVNFSSIGDVVGAAAELNGT